MRRQLRRNLKRTGLGLLLILVLLVVLALGAATWLLGTGSGGRWLSSQIPGLTISGFEGRLAGQWQADSLTWESDGLQVRLLELAINWSALCLIEREVCLEALSVGSVDVAMGPTKGEAESQSREDPLTLPEIDLPASVTVDRLTVDRLTFNGTVVMENLETVLAMSGSEIHIERLSVAREELQLQLSGVLTTAGDWPIDAHLELQMPVAEEQIEASLDAQGRIGRNVSIAAETRGYVEATLSGLVQPLEPGVPVEITAKPTRLPLPKNVPPTARPENIEITAIGNLSKGWSIDASARLPAEGEPIPLELNGHVTTTGARIDRLRLNAGKGHKLQLEGTLDWEEATAARARLEWRDFPWQRLLPEVGPVPVELQTLNAKVSYANDSYQGQIDAEFSGPAGQSRLSTPFTGDLSHVQLPTLSLRAGPGGVEGSVAINFADQLGWQADLQVSELNPSFWIAALPGELNGTVQSEGQLTETGPALTAAIDLKGRLRGQQAEIQVDAQAGQERWQADPLLVTLGDNRISGSASQDKNLSASLDLNLARLGQLWPGLSGALSGKLQASGWPAAPQVDLSLDSRSLSYEETRLESLALDASLDGETIVLDAKLQGVEAAGQRVEQVRFDGNGTLAEHQLRVRAEEARGTLDLTFSGGSEILALPIHGQAPSPRRVAEKGEDPAAIWTGRLTDGELSFAAQDWVLQSPTSLAYRENGVATLGAHCWRWRDASLCAEDQRLWPDPRIRLALEDLPTSVVNPVLPPEVRWLGSINAEIEVDLGEDGPDGRVSVEAGPGQFSMLEIIEEDESGGETEWIEYPYDVLQLNVDLTPARVIADVRITGPDLGEFEAEARVENPNGTPRPLRGSFTLQALDLAIIRPFAQLQELEGTISGRGDIRGTLIDPTITGQLNLEHGQLADRRLPLRFDDLSLQVRFTESSAELEGDWRSGEQGRGNIGGEVSWEEGLSAAINITGQRLPATLEPFAEVEIAPDLRVTYSGEQLRLTGQLEVPRGAVEIRELPPQAVKVSEDEVIVGDEAPEEDEEQPEATETPPIQNLSMSIEVIVGEDKLTFDGFGVTGKLVGRLRIGDNLDTRGELSLRDGQYEIYGQQLQLRTANLLFAGPIGQPFLEIEAVRNVNDVTAGIRLTGPADNPSTEVFSEPAMSEEQALSYLLLGRPLKSEQDSNVVGSAALSIGLNQAAPLTRAIGERLGVEDLQLESEGTGESQRIVATGYLSEKLSVRYGVGLFNAVNRLALRYELTERLYLEAASGLASSLDIFYSRDF